MPLHSTDHPCDRTGEGVHEILARVANRSPDTVALVDGSRARTYGELLRDATAWAARLHTAGVGPGQIVPLLLPRGIEQVTALLAVLQTGAAYAALDPTIPDRRLREVLNLLDPPLLVTDDPRAGGHATPIWSPPAEFDTAPVEFHPARVRGDDPCCVFLTSGTTGTAKAVLTPHRATTRLFTPGASLYRDTGTVMPLAAPVSWDAFSLELWSALLTGGTSIIVTEPYLTGAAVRTFVAEHGVDVVWLTSSLFNMIVEEDLDAFTGLDRLLVGGERLSSGHVARFLDAHPAIELINGYGPVENTVFATTHRVTRRDCLTSDEIPLGVAVSGTEVHVLADHEPCTAGTVGEIYLSGEGVALGYIGERERTAAAFAPVVVAGRTLRAYRTGDLGSWGPDGLLRYHGRRDRQVKIRGHRVEPAEVERQVERLSPRVRSCRVLARPAADGTTKELIAFCVPERPGDRLDDVSDVLRSGLVAYHRPAAVVSVARFPVTARGKLDEESLLARAPRTATVRRAARATEASDDLEKVVGEAFHAVLGLDDIPPHTPFTELGGDSLGAGRVCARIAAQIGRPVPVSAIFRHPTAASLASALGAPAPTIPPERADAPRDLPLRPTQLIYLTEHLLNPTSPSSHCLLVWEVTGPLDPTALAAAVAAVHRSHQALSTAYLPDPRPLARHLDLPPPVPRALAPRARVSEAVAAVRTALSEPLQPCDGRVWAAAIAPVSDSATTVFGCVVHHIAFDGRSESVLARALSGEYARALGTEAADIPVPTSAAIHRRELERASSIVLDEQRALARAELNGVPVLRWPESPTRTSPAPPRELVWRLDPSGVEAVDAQARASGVTRFAVLLARYARSLALVTGQDDFAVGVPVAHYDDDLYANTIGCHLNVVPVRWRGGAASAGALGARSAAEAVRRAMSAQDVPFAESVRFAGPRPAGRPPLFQTLFALQNNEPPDLDLLGARTTFLRQPYAELPLELHTELWPDRRGGIRVVISYRPQSVADTTAERLFDTFTGLLAVAEPGERS
ncbi:amino acid adenylation domain-containing protein [Nocardia takedensis]